MSKNRGVLCVGEGLVEAWNSQYPPGSPVIVIQDDGSQVESKTRSVAWTLGHGDAVVKYEGLAGGYDLSRVIPQNTAKPSCKLGSKYYFYLTIDEDSPQYWIVSKELWEKHGRFDDREINGVLKLPDCFNEVAESVFEYECPKETLMTGTQMLLELGFTENSDLANMCD